MAAVTPIQVTEAGVANATLTTPSASDTYAWHADLHLVFTNGNASTLNVTVTEIVSGTISDGRYGDLEKSNATVAIATGNTGMIGPFKREAFRNSSGNITVTTDVQSSVTVLPIYIA